MAAEIQRQDIITDDALAAPLQLAKNIDVAVASLGKLVKMGVDNKNTVTAAQSTAQLTKETNNLGLAQQELIKIQKQIAIAQARENESYQTGVKILKAVKDAIKEKNSISEQEARTTNATTASYLQLQAALNKNRQVYQQLTGDQQRNSTQGKELLKVIQAQDKAFKDLGTAMGQSQANVGNYPQAVAVLDSALSGLITRLKEVGVQMWALVKNPFVAIAAVIVAGFVAMKEAAEDYYSATLAGEEALERETLKASARTKVYKEQWIDFGKVVSMHWEVLKDDWRKFIDIFTSNEMTDTIKRRQALAKEAAEQLSKQQKEHIKDIVDDARTEIEVNELLARAKDKVNFTAQERIEALHEAIRLSEEQAQGDLELALNDEKAETKKLESQGKRLINGKLLADYTDDEITATKLTGAELQKVASLQIATLKISSDLAEKRKSWNKQEAALLKEIDGDRKEAHDNEVKRQKEIADAAAKANQILIDNYNIGFAIEKKKYEDAEKLRKANAKNIEDEDAAESQRLGKLYGDRLQEKMEKDAEAAAEALALEEEMARAREVLVQRTADLIRTLFVAESVERINELNVQLNALSIAKDKEIKEAGDNAAEKDKIERKYAAQQQALQKQIAKEKHDLAIKERDIAIANTIIHTAEAVVKGLKDGGLPLAILYGLIGAAELATIIATPIPQYAKGTKNHKGGGAIIGELGAELVKEPGKPWTLSPDKATLTTLAPGSKVITHDESMKMLAMSALGEQSFLDRENRELQHEIKELRRDINRSTDRTVDAILSKGGEYFEQGTYTYRKQKKNDGSYQIIRLKNHPE